METEELEKLLKYVNINGMTLNIEERISLRLAFQQLQNDFKLDNLLFWGKFIGSADS